MQGKPSGKVLQGYWENWDGAANGVHPPFGWTPVTDSRIRSHGYNVLNAAFPVIRSDGTVLWEDGMDSTVKVAGPAEMCRAKEQGQTLLMSIGGATAGIDLSSRTVADRFVETIVPVLKEYNFDGIASTSTSKPASPAAATSAGSRPRRPTSSTSSTASWSGCRRSSA